jgi:hypothetical protein
MPEKISYKFTIPDEKYADFKKDITAIATAAGTAADKIKYDDENHAATFDYDSNDIFVLFASNLDRDKYPFFSCRPSEYQKNGHIRYEDGAEISYDAAYQTGVTKYKHLSPPLFQ